MEWPSGAAASGNAESDEKSDQVAKSHGDRIARENHDIPGKISRSPKIPGVNVVKCQEMSG